MDKSKSERVIINKCSLDDSESKSVHISVNMSEVKYAKNETNDEETWVTDNSVINASKYFNLFECSNLFLNTFYAMCDQACMATTKETYDT